MRATVNKLNRSYGNCELRTENDILIVIRIPDGISLSPGDELRISELRVNASVSFLCPAKSLSFSAIVEAQNAHDLRLPAKHGSTRTPSSERLRGA